MNILPPRILRPLIQAAIAALMLTTSPSMAANLQVAPTSITLRPTENAGALWLSNADEKEPLRAQVRVFRWTQNEGEDTLEPARDVSVSPPMLELPAGERQLIRIIRTGAPPAGAEVAYRVLVDELPPDAPLEGGGLRFAMRYSVPVFVLPAGETPVRYALQTRLERGGPQPVLVATNSGTQHAQIADLSWSATDGARTGVIAGLVGYVLPGQTMRWALPATLPANGSGHLLARINGEPEEQTLAMDPAGR